jgi:hypothetical protein
MNFSPVLNEDPLLRSMCRISSKESTLKTDYKTRKNKIRGGKKRERKSWRRIKRRGEEQGEGRGKEKEKEERKEEDEKKTYMKEEEWSDRRGVCNTSHRHCND